MQKLTPWSFRVKIEEVSDDWEDSSSTSSSDSLATEADVDDFDPSAETVLERFYALKDIVPPSTRASVSDTTDAIIGWVKWSVGLAGSAAWIITTSALLVGLPAMLSIEGEGALVAQEKEFLGQQQVSLPFFFLRAAREGNRRTRDSAARGEDGEKVWTEWDSTRCTTASAGGFEGRPS